MLVTHVTAAQFAASAPERTGDVAWRSHTDDPRCNVGSDRGEHPANCVNWYAARAWCAGLGMRLPTEAEWEHAARAGTETAYWWGETFDATRAVACATEGCEATQAVATEGPRCNPWGVCDVSGNVWEWTRTTWDAPPHDLGDPLASNPTTGLMRGGSMVAAADDPVLQVGYRSDLNLQNPNFYMGFRCVR
jgi:formylglycine-generating enzyme required for sulfatase activity